MPTRDILFTGANSFAGRAAFSSLVSRGHRVVAASRTGVSGHESYRVDLSRDGAESALPDRAFDTLIHFASLVPEVEAASTWSECAPTNVQGLIRLLNWAKGRVKRVVLASSCAVYGVRPSDVPITEDRGRWPDSYYGISKMAQEDIVRSFCMASGIPWASLRLGYVYGPGMRRERATVKFLEQIRDGMAITLMNPDRSGLNLIHVDDIATIVAHAVDDGIGEFNLSPSRHITLREIIAVSEKVVGRVSTLIEETDPDAPMTNWYSAERLELVFGRIDGVSLESGLQSVFDALQDEKGMAAP